MLPPRVTFWVALGDFRIFVRRAGLAPVEMQKVIDKTKNICYNEKNFVSSPNQKGIFTTIRMNVQKHSGKQENHGKQ